MLTAAFTAAIGIAVPVGVLLQQRATSAAEWPAAPDKPTLESAIQANLSNETVRLPLSTDAGQPLTAVLERCTYVAPLNNASFNGGDDFLGSASGTLHPHATDGPTGWRIDLGAVSP